MDVRNDLGDDKLGKNLPQYRSPFDALSIKHHQTSQSHCSCTCWAPEVGWNLALWICGSKKAYNKIKWQTWNMKDYQTINPYQKQAPHHCEWPAECSWEWCDSSWFPARTSADSAVARLKATSNKSACLHGVSSKFQDLRANILNDTGQIDTPGAKRLKALAFPSGIEGKN